MIEKASELLELFIHEEKKKLESFDMPHMPTLGEAYEEITKQAIDNAFVLPEHLDLRVVSGFISIQDETLTQQIDCMLVHGEGVRYGLTEKYVYDIDSVLSIFEVKKTLRKTDYDDAFEHLREIRKKYAEYFETRVVNDDFQPDLILARKHFSQITGKVAPTTYSGMHTLPKSEAVLFYTLIQESLAPVSIIHGYGGYQTESGLRTAFGDIIENKSKISREGLGIPSIPSLVISSDFCVIKANGMPFLCVLDNDDWVAVVSTRYNPAKLILELLWSKISFYFNVEMPWDEGLYIENPEPLLTAQFVERKDEEGWEYNFIPYKEPDLIRNDNKTWEPALLGIAEISAIYIMMVNGGYLPLDEEVDESFREDDSNLAEVVENLLETRVFMKSGDYIRPIHQCTHILKCDDGTGYVANERDRFDIWCEGRAVEPTYMNLIMLE